MNRTPMISVVVSALLFVGCAGFFGGVARDTGLPDRWETTPTEEPTEVAPDPEPAAESPDHLGEASTALVNATFGLSRMSAEAGLSNDSRWSGALDIWFREVDYWLRAADGNLFEHSSRGTAWTRQNRMTTLLDLEQRVMALRSAHRRLNEAFQSASASSDIVVESMPEVRAALEEAGRAIRMTESAIDTLAVQLGLR